MLPKSAALLWGAATAAGHIQGFVAGRTRNDYSSNLLLRSGVERQFEIADEAMNVLRNTDRATADRVPNVKKIVGMRNIPIHGYAVVNDTTVWRAATEDLDVLIVAIDALLSEFGPPSV